MSLWHRHTFPLREHQRAFFFFLSLFLVPSNRIQFNDSIEYVPYHSAATISRKQQTKRSWFWFTHHSPEWIHVSFANVVWQNRVRFVFLCFFFSKKRRNYCQVESGKDAWYMDAYFLSLFPTVSEDTASMWSRFDRDSSQGTHDSTTWVFVVFDLISLYRTSDDM